jgi:hypothetical protein
MTGTAYLVPILVRKLLAGVSPLNASAGEQDLGLQALAGDGRDNALDRVPVR